MTRRAPRTVEQRADALVVELTQLETVMRTPYREERPNMRRIWDETAAEYHEQATVLASIASADPMIVAADNLRRFLAQEKLDEYMQSLVAAGEVSYTNDTPTGS